MRACRDAYIPHEDEGLLCSSSPCPKLSSLVVAEASFVPICLRSIHAARKFPASTAVAVHQLVDNSCAPPSIRSVGGWLGDSGGSNSKPAAAALLSQQYCVSLHQRQRPAAGGTAGAINKNV